MATQINEGHRKLLDRLLSGPLGKKMAVEEASERHQQRKEAAAAIKAVEKDREQALPKLILAKDKLMEEWNAAHLALQELGVRVRQAEGDLRSASWGYDRAIQAQEGILRELTPAELIGDFRRELVGLFDEVCANVYSSSGHSGMYEDERRAAAKAAEEWRAAQDKSLTAVKAALDELNNIHLLPLSDEEFEAKIEAMRTTVLASMGR